MRKFIVHSVKGTTTIMEVECEVITALQDPQVSWEHLPSEYKVQILKPESLLDKDGRPVIYYSYALFDSVDSAKVAAEKDIATSYIRTCQKSKSDFEQSKLDVLLNKINIIML